MITSSSSRRPFAVRSLCQAFASMQRKRILTRCLSVAVGGKAIPTEIRGEEKRLRYEMEYDDEVHEKPMNHIDDEYKNAGMFDPKVAITTSRDPSSRLKQFAQEIRLIFPNAIRLNRGAHTIGDVRHCRAVLVSRIWELNADVFFV